MKLDLTKADTGRIIDYWLGGHHNFEVDRIAADKVAALTPTAPKWARAQRTFLQRAVAHMSEVAGLDRFLVAGSGLPTCGNVHEVAPKARVVYTDINPITIAYGQNIIGPNPNVRYVHCNATKLHTLAPDLEEFFGEGRPMGIVYVGIAYFFPDAVVEETLQALYDWAAEGSHLALSYIGRDSERYASASLQAYAQMGNPINPRDPVDIVPLLGRWQLTPEGVMPATVWGDGQLPPSEEPVFIYGCVAAKPVAVRRDPDPVGSVSAEQGR